MLLEVSIEVKEIIKITFETKWTITGQMYSIKAKDRSNAQRKRTKGRDECDTIGNIETWLRTWCGDATDIFNPMMLLLVAESYPINPFDLLELLCKSVSPYTLYPLEWWYFPWDHHYFSALIFSLNFLGMLIMHRGCRSRVLLLYFLAHVAPVG